MLSLICGEEAGKWDEAEPDRTEFVWRKEARLLAMYIPKVETHMFSQRFSEANAVTLQTYICISQWVMYLCKICTV